MSTVAETPDLELVQVREAARRYPIGVRRLYRLIHEGAIPAVIIDNPTHKRILVRPQAVADYLRSLERRHGPA